MYSELQNFAQTVETGDILCQEIVSRIGLSDDNLLEKGSDLFDYALEYCDTEDIEDKKVLLKKVLQELKVKRTIPLN